MAKSKTVLFLAVLFSLGSLNTGLLEGQQVNPDPQPVVPQQMAPLNQPLATGLQQDVQRSNVSLVPIESTQHSVTENDSTQPDPTTEVPPVDTFQLSGRFHLVEGTRQGYLILRAEIPDGSYIYSLTNNEGPPPCQITVAPGHSFQVGEPFQSDRYPTVIEMDEVFQCRLEKHYQLVQFYVPIEVADGVDPATIRPELTFNGQICSDEGFCMPLDDKIVAAEFGGYFQQQAQAESTGDELDR